MTHKATFRKSILGLFGSILLYSVGAADPTFGQIPEAQPPACFTQQERIVVHGIYWGRGNEMNAGSKAMLDYTVQLLKANPKLRVYIASSEDRTKLNEPNSRDKAVASYLERNGIAAGRLIMPGDPRFYAQQNASSSNLQQVAHNKAHEVLELDSAPKCSG